MKDTRIVNNQTGVGINNASNIGLDNCVIQGNGSQIGGWSPSFNRDGYRYGNLTIRNCVITGTNENQALFRLPTYPEIYKTLQSRGNHWHRPSGGGWYIGGDALDCRGWQTRTRQDRDSFFLPIRHVPAVAQQSTKK